MVMKSCTGNPSSPGLQSVPSPDRGVRGAGEPSPPTSISSLLKLKSLTLLSLSDPALSSATGTSFISVSLSGSWGRWVQSPGACKGALPRGGGRQSLKPSRRFREVDRVPHPSPPLAVYASSRVQGGGEGAPSDTASPLASTMGIEETLVPGSLPAASIQQPQSTGESLAVVAAGQSTRRARR